MFDGAVLTFVALYVCAFIVVAILQKRVEISFFWLSGAIFFVYIAPKLMAYFLSGDAVFLPGAAVLGAASSDAAIVCITAFMSAILAVYGAARLVMPEGPPAPPVDTGFDPDRAVMLATWIFVPLFTVSFYAYWVAADVTLDNLFAKRELVLDGERTFAWALQKVAQLVKSGLYLVLLATLVTRDTRYTKHLALFAVLAALVYMVSSQRSGLLILALEIALVFQVAGIMKPRYYVYLVASFAALNIAILSARAMDTAQSLYWSDLIYRRYFFDLEKIAAMVEYFVSDPLYRFEPFGILAAPDNGIRPDYASHFYIAEQVFGISGGVPPSILGEMIIYLGPVSILPVTALLTAGLIWAERRMRRSASPFTQLALAVVLSKLYFLTLNSDTPSSLNRIALDLVLMGAGVGVYALGGGRFGAIPERRSPA